jgi:hypothetical protein
MDPGVSTSLIPQLVPPYDARVENPTSGKYVYATVELDGCFSQRRFAFITDSLTPSYTSSLSYDTCQNLYAISLTGNNPTAEKYRFATTPGDTLLGPTATFKAEGGSTVFRVWLEATRRGCKANNLYSIALKDASLNPVSAFTIFTNYPTCNGPAEISVSRETSTPGTPSYTLDGIPFTSFRVLLPDSLPHTIQQIVRLGPCADTANQVIARPLLTIGNVLTPNYDGKNDALLLPHESKHNWRISVYNRWGKLVQDWDNYPNAAFPGDAPSGVYYYKLWSSLFNEACTGWIEVVR